jgi:transcriptional regulator with XRE-family HTH domain
MAIRAGAPPSRAACFINRRIYELRSRRSQAEIAAAAGFTSASFLAMIKTGRAKLPIERAAPLAKALDCDPAHMLRLALEQVVSKQVLADLYELIGIPLTANEREILNFIRSTSADRDPELTARRQIDLAFTFA